MFREPQSLPKSGLMYEVSQVAFWIGKDEHFFIF